MIGRRLGHYEVLARLGEGGMGIVYKAHDTHLDRFAAIKVLPPQAVADPHRKQRFTQEAKAASALNHSGIVTIYDITESDGIHFIAMEYVEGKTLSELIGRQGLGLKDTLNYAIQVAGALAKAHATGIVHRDLKPSNIMITDDGVVKVLDFGVAKLLDSAEPGEDSETRTVRPTHPLQTAPGQIVGTVAYMSPEQAEGKRVDARSDIFSFGAVLYEMATGIRAFRGESSALTLAAVVNAEPAPPSQLRSDLPRDLERIILRCLRKDPTRRVQFIADLAVELEEIKTESGTRIAAVDAPAVKRRGRWMAASAAAVGFAALGTWLFWPKLGEPLPSPSLSPLTSFAGDERLASFSPDGKQVAFAWNGENGANTDIYVLPVGSGTPLRLTTDPADDRAPAWSPDGQHIAFVRLQEDKRAIYLSTAPVPNSEQKLTDIVSEPPPGGDVVSVSWFPDGERLAAAERDASGQMNGIVVIPVDHSEPRRLLWTPVAAGTYHQPAVSPTASHLGYVLCVGPGNCDVYLAELATDLTIKGAPRRLTELGSNARGLAWMPDGRTLIHATGAGVSTTFMWRVSIAGGAPQRLELAGDHAAYPAVARQGDMMAYARLATEADIWRFAPTGQPENFLSSTLDDRNPEFSPNGKSIVFESRRLGKDSQLWVANADGTNPRPLLEGVKGISGSPRWSSDSRLIVFDGQDQSGQLAIQVVDAEGGRPRVVTTRGYVPSWSRDGKWIYFGSQRTGRSEVWRVPAAGGEPIQVTDTGGADAIESVDGKTLYYRSVGPPSALMARDVAGGPARQVADSLPLSNHQYVPVQDGVYYVPRPDPSLPFAFELRFINSTTGQSTTLSRFQARTGQGLAVSPDRKTILYSGTKPSDGTDLVLIRDFR